MPNAVEVVKQAAVEAVEAGKPVHVLFGTVIGAAPLKIQVDQKAIFPAQMLILTRNVTDYSFSMTVNHSTGTAEGHSHSYSGKKTFTVHNALAVGEKVVMLRVQKGGRYVVLDRVKEAGT